MNLSTSTNAHFTLSPYQTGPCGYITVSDTTNPFSTPLPRITTPIFSNFSNNKFKDYINSYKDTVNKIDLKTERNLKSEGNDELICLEIDRVIFNDPATIIFWKDKTKTVVKCAKGQKFNKYHGFCAAVTKRVFENNSQVNRLVNSGIDAEDPIKTAAKNPDSKPLKDEKSKKSSKKGKKS
jgi:hypothetical protein